MSPTALLAHSIIVTQISGFINISSFLQSLRIQCSFIDTIGFDEFNLTGLSKRVLSRQCQVLDPLPLLREASIPWPARTSDLGPFNTLCQARESLEGVLNTAAFQVKSGNVIDPTLLDTWQANFTKLRDSSDDALWLTIKASYGMAKIMIETMYSTNETIYDNYLEVYSDVADAYEAMLASSKPGVQYRFNIDAGFMCLVGWAVRWCRQPSLRNQLINLLRQTRRNEAAQSSTAWARIVAIVKAIEECGILPPPTSCTDIPEHKRIRVQAAAFYYKARLIRIDYLRHPYSGSPECVWVPITPPGENGVTFEVEPPGATSQPKPDWIMGPAYSSFALSDDYENYCTLRSPEFYFFIPRL